MPTSGKRSSRVRIAGEIGALIAAAVGAAAFFEWGLSREAPRAAAIEMQGEMNSVVSLVGSYQVTGTDPDGIPYRGSHILDISLAPSGALELDWDNGRQIGIGRVAGDVLAAAFLSKGRTSVIVLRVNQDGSLSGTWLRRTDRGSQGSEVWTKMSGRTLVVKDSRSQETNGADVR